MDIYKQLVAHQTKEKELIKNIIVNHLHLNNVAKEIYLRDMSGESWSTISKELDISTGDIYNSLKRTNHTYHKWIKEQENKTV